MGNIGRYNLVTIKRMLVSQVAQNNLQLQNPDHGPSAWALSLVYTYCTYAIYRHVYTYTYKCTTTTHIYMPTCSTLCACTYIHPIHTIYVYICSETSMYISDLAQTPKLHPEHPPIKGTWNLRSSGVLQVKRSRKPPSVTGRLMPQPLARREPAT